MSIRSTRRNVIRSSTTKIPGSNISQASFLIQHRGIRSDVRDGGAEGAEVRVALDVWQTIEVLGRAIEEALRIRKVGVVECIFTDPDRSVGIS